MHGRKWLAGFTLFTIALAGCASKTLLQPDCHSCTVEEQEWKDFSFASLGGKWKGSVETWKNERDSKKKVKDEKVAELQFLTADEFLKTRGSTGCAGLPAGSLVLNGLFWQNASEAKEYDAFIPVEDDKVAYGRLSFEKMNGKDFCQFRRYGRVMGKNRLNLPSVSFSDAVLPGGRNVASTGKEREISVEFLRFVKPNTTAAFTGVASRRPASLGDAERPPLMLRVFQVQSITNKDRGEWSYTEEQIYRLWRSN
ncbi:MAG: hypothetical protein ACXWQO_03515 [Bdellovibrionota bacterium]